jgi:hypothetical protein
LSNLVVFIESTCREIGFALFHEGGDALAIILGKSQFAHGVTLAVELAI